MSKRRKLLINIILITIMVLLVLVSTLLYINFYPRVSLHLISDDALYDTLQIKKNSSVPTLKKPEKEGYVFVGWYTDQACTEPFQYNQSIANDMELYAKYEAIDYSLNYYFYDYLGSDILYSDIYSSQIQHVGDHIWTPDGTEEILIKGETTALKDLYEGYTFIGWSTTQPKPNSTNVLCSAGGDFLMPASDVKLYAVWEPNLYTVTFLVQDLGDNVKVDVDADGFVKYDKTNQKVFTSQAYKYSSKMDPPISPMHDKDYYKFVGWFLDPEFTKPIRFDQAHMGLNQISNYKLNAMYDSDNSEPIVLYGKWQVEEFDILFCLNKDARTGSTYKIVDSSIMVEDSNGSVLNSDYFKAKTGYYYNVKMRQIDGGVYSNELLDGQVYYSSQSSVVSHRFLGWYTEKNGGKLYNNETLFNPEDFDSYYTYDTRFNFLRPKVKTYILYANWEEFYHVEYVYNGKIYDTQPVVANTSEKLRGVMSGIKRNGYYFDGWSRTQSNTDLTVYKTDVNYKFITNASMSGDNTLYFGTSRKITLYPHWSPNEYHIKYDFSINTLSDNKITCIESNPQNIEYSDYLIQKLKDNPDPVVRYNYVVGSEIESHTVYNSIDASGQSNAKYTKGNTVYLLCGWAIVDADNNVKTYNDGVRLNNDIYKYSQKRNNKTDDGAYDFVIKAIWKTQITVTFDKGFDDVEGNVPEPISAITGSTITIPTNPNPTRPYHIFKGWVTAENRTKADGSEEYNPAVRFVGRNTTSFGEDTVLYASWAPIVYTLNIYNTNVDGSRGSLLKQIKMTYAEYAGNVASVTLSNTISFGDSAVDIVVPNGYALDGFSLSATGNVVYSAGTQITVSSTYQIDDDDNQTTQNLFDPTKAASASIFVKYSIKEYTVVVNVFDPDGNIYENPQPIVVDEVTHGTVVGGNSGFISTNNIIGQISLEDGVSFDYWKISDVDGEITDILKCYQIIDRDLTISLYTKIQTYEVSFLVVDPNTQSVLDTRVYKDIRYGSTIDSISGIDTTIPEVFGFENAEWYFNGEKVDDINAINVCSSITFISNYTPRQVDVVYHKSLDEDVTYSAIVEYNSNFVLPKQDVKDQFVVAEKQLAKWIINDGTEVGIVGTSLNMSLEYFKSLLNMSESEVKELFEEKDGVLTLNLYASYAILYSLTFADNDKTFEYSGQNTAVLEYIEGQTIDLVDVVKKYITNITSATGYVYNQEWQVVGTDKTFNLNDQSFDYDITENTSIMPIVEKQTYPIRFYTVYSDNSEGVLEGTFKDISVQLDDEIVLPNINDVENILSHNGISYRALKWYLGNAEYELGNSITITADLLEGIDTLSFRLEVLQLRQFTYYAGKPGIAGQSIVGATGDVITVGNINGTPFENFKSDTNYPNYISAWKIDGVEYAYGDSYTITDSTPSAFYAVWTVKTVNVVYHQNAYVDDEKTYIETNDFNSTFQVKNQTQTQFEKSMHLITGWSQNPDGSGDCYTLTDMLNLKQTDDFHLYAIWTRVYNVIYSDSQTGAEYASQDVLYVDAEYTLLSSEALSSVFTKEGHYIAQWQFGAKLFNPEDKVTADDLGNPEGESITFVVVWGADSLTVTIRYTDTSNNVYGTPKIIKTTFGATLGKTSDIMFDNERKIITDTNDIEYRFSHFVDQNGTTYSLDENGYIDIGVVTKNLVLTTVYAKVLKLTYNLSSLGKTNIVIEYGDGDAVNTLLTSADDRIGAISNAVLVGWKDGTQNYRIALSPTDSGYNYSKSWLGSFEIKSNVTLTPVVVSQYSLTVWKDLKDAGEFDSDTKEVILLVEGDIVAREFDDSIYKGFVRNADDYKYNPNAECNYQSNFSFELTNKLVNAYSDTKSINLYPVKYVYITFDITELNFSETFKYVAGENITSLPNEVQNKVVDNDVVYFDSWLDLSDSTEVRFEASATDNKYYKDTTIKAVYLNFYSIQYKLLDANQYDIYKIKLGESNNLLNKDVAEQVYKKDGQIIVGFSVCYTEDNVLGAHYKEDGKTKVFDFDQAIIASDGKFGGNRNLFIFPVYKPALVNISFGLGDADANVFSMENANTYTVEADADFTISKTDETISITFNNITNEDTRDGENVTVTVTVDKMALNCTLIAFKFGDENITESGKFKYSQDVINITFAYSTNTVTLDVFVKYNDEIQTSLNYGCFTTTDARLFEAKFMGDGSISTVLTAQEIVTSTYIARFVGWYKIVGGVETVILTDDVFDVSGDSGQILTITNMTESFSVYAKFVAGYVTVTQKIDFLDYRNNNNVDFIFDLSAVYTNIVTVDDQVYSGNSVALKQDTKLAINPHSTISVVYTLNTTENWKLWGVQIGDDQIQLDSDGKITYNIDTQNVDIVLLVVPINVTVVFKGFNSVDLGESYTKIYAYNSTIDLDAITNPDDVEGYTFVSWNYENTPLTDDTTIITSNWEKLYKVQIIDTKDSNKNSEIYVIYRQSNTNISSTNGEHTNFFTLNSADVQNFKLEGYNIDYKFDGTQQQTRNIDSDITKIYYHDFVLHYLDNSVVNNEYAKVTDIIITTVYSRLFSIVDESSTTLQSNLKKDTKFDLSGVYKEGYTFKGWEFSYVNPSGTTIKSDVIDFSQSKSLVEIFGGFNDDSCPSSVINTSAVFEINTYTLEFVIPDSMSKYGNLSDQTQYTLNWSTTILFETYENNSGGKAKFTTAKGQEIEFEVTAENGYNFTGFYDSEDSATKLSRLDFKSDKTIYCKFGTNPVSVEANLTYYVGSETTDNIGGYIVVNENKSSSYITYDTYHTDDVFTFSLEAETGFTLSSVKYSMGDINNQSLSNDGNGLYSIILTGNCTLNIVFDANTTGASIIINNISGLTETPFVTISDPDEINVESVESLQFATGLYTTSATFKFKPNTNYYSVNKISYKLNGGSQEDFIINTARASSDYTYYIDNDGYYVVNYVYASNNIEIIVELDVRQVEITVYNLNGSQYTKLYVKYGKTLKYSDITIANDFEKEYLFKYSDQGALVATNNKAEAIGGYHFDNGWTDGDSVMTSASGTINITGDIALYPAKVKDYKVVFEAFSTDSDKIYSVPSPNYVWISGSTISLNGFATKYTLKTGFQFEGYNIFVGQNNSPNITGSISVGDLSYDSNFKWNGNDKSQIDISEIDSLFAISEDADKHIIYFAPIINLIQFEVNFGYETQSGANGSMTIKDVSGNDITSPLTLEYSDKVIREGNVLTICSSDNITKYTITYMPDPNCKVGSIKYGSKDMGEMIIISDNQDLEFKAIFVNGDVSVNIRFDVDKNLVELNNNVFKLTITGDGLSYTISYDDDKVETPTSITNKQFKQSFTLTVTGTRSEKFTYEIQVIENSYYDCVGGESGIITFTSENNGTVVVTAHLQYKYNTISVAKSVDDSIADKCKATLVYQEPVKDSNGVITDYMETSLELTTSLQEVVVYEGDEIYIKIDDCHVAYKVKGVYDSESNGKSVAEYNSTYNRYKLDLSKSNSFYVLFEIKTVELSFKVNYNNTTWVYQEGVTFSATDFEKFANELNNFNMYDNIYDLNEYFVTNSFEYKSNYANIMLVKKTYTIGGHAIESYWDLDGLTKSNNGIEYIDKYEITANYTSAVLVTFSVNNSTMGFFEAYEDDKKPTTDYVLYSSTLNDDKFNTAIYKVVNNNVANSDVNKISVLPEIAPKPQNELAFEFVQFVFDSNNYSTWEDLSVLNVSDDMVIAVEFKERTYDIVVQINVLLGKKADLLATKDDTNIVSDITLTLNATSTFKDVLYGENGIYAQLLARTEEYRNKGYWDIELNTQAVGDDYYWIYVFKNCVDKQYWYEACNASLMIGEYAFGSEGEDGILINGNTSIYTYVDKLKSLRFDFVKSIKNKLTIEANQALTNAYKLKTTEDGNYYLSFIKTDSAGHNVFTFVDNNSSTMYVVPNETINLENVGLLNTSDENVLLNDICRYTSGDIQYNNNYYTFSHFSVDGNNYMTVFDYDDSTKVRTLSNNGNANNNSIKLGGDCVLTVNILNVYELNVILSTRNSDEDAILNNYGAYWNCTEFVFDGEQVEVSRFINLISKEALAGKLYSYDQTYMYIMSGESPSTLDVAHDSIIVSGNTVLYNLVSIKWTTKNISIAKKTDFYGDKNVSSTITIKHLTMSEYNNMFEDYSNIDYVSNNLPYIIVDGEWTLNNSSWNIDDDHTFVGYLCTLDGSQVVIGTGGTKYIDKNKKEYTIKTYNDLSASEIIKLNKITSFTAVYHAGKNVVMSRDITTYLIDKNGNQNKVTGDALSKYSNGYNKYGYKINITYTDINGDSYTETIDAGNSSIELCKVQYGTEIKVQISLASWYSVDNTNTSYTVTESTDNISLPINAYYYDLSLPSAIDWTVTSADQNLFDGVTSSTWTFPKGASYTITNSVPTGNRMSGASTTFKMTVIDHNGNKSENTITATYNNENNIAVVQDGISGTVFTTFQDVQGGIKSTEGTINSIVSGTVLNLYSYTPIVVDARVSVQGSVIKTYNDYIMYYYNSTDNTAVLYHDKVLYIGLTDGEEGYFSKIGDKYVDEFVKAFIEKIYGDSEVNTLITGKNGTLTLNIRTMSVTSSSAEPSVFLLSTDSTNSTDLITDYAYNSLKYIFTLEKNSDLPDNIGFLESDIAGDLDNSYLKDGFEYVSSVKVNKDSIVIEGNRYEGGAIYYYTDEDDYGKYIGINYYMTSDASGESVHTAKIYRNGVVARFADLDDGVMLGSESAINKSVDILTYTYTLAMVEPDTNKAYTDSAYHLTITYRADFDKNNLEEIISGAATGLFNSKSDDISYYTSPFKVTSYSKVEGVDYINLTAWADDVENSVENESTFERYVDVSYGDAFKSAFDCNPNEYSLPIYSNSKKWSRFLGITDSASDSVYTLNYDSKTNSLKYNNKISDSMTNIYINDTTHYLSFEIYENSIYSYDYTESIFETYDSNLYNNTIDIEGNIVWNSRYEISITNYSAELNQVKIRTFGGAPTAPHGISDSTLTLKGKYASYVMCGTTVNTENQTIKLSFEQSEYTVVLYGQEGMQGSESDFLQNQDNYYYMRLGVGSTMAIDDWQSELAKNYITLPDRYIKYMYEIAYFTTEDPTNKLQVSYRNYLGTSGNVNNGLMFLYPLYNPQRPYTDELFKYSSDNHTITGWNYSRNARSAYYKYFGGSDNYKLLVIPEWNFVDLKAYKVSTIAFCDDYSSYYSVFVNQDIYCPADIEYVYIGKYITSIVGLDEDTSAVYEDGFYGSHDGIVNSTTASSITRLTWAMYGENKLKGYIVSIENNYYKSSGFTGSDANLADNSVLKNNNLWSDGRVGTDMDVTGIGLLMDKSETRLLHTPAQFGDKADFVNPGDFSVVNALNKLYTIDPFAFAYKVKYAGYGSPEIKLQNIKNIGSCAWYGAGNNFATTIKFVSTNLDYIGYQIVDARNINMDIWFYDKVPFIYHDYTGIYKNTEEKYNSVLNVGMLTTYNKNWTSGNITVHYQPDYDFLYSSDVDKELQKYMRASRSLEYLFNYAFDGDPANIMSFEGGRMVFEMIETDSSVFVVKNNVIKGINNDKVSDLFNRKVILLPTNYVTGVDYLGRVDSQGNKLTTKLDSTLSLDYIVIPSTYTHVGSILNVLDASGDENVYFRPGVNVTNISIAFESSTADWSSIGDGVYSPFGDRGEFGVVNIIFPNVNVIESASYWANNTTITSIKFKSTTKESEWSDSVLIGDYGLAGLTNLASIQGNIRGLGNYALQNCAKLTYLDYGYSMNEYGLSSIAYGIGQGSGLCSISLNGSVQYGFDESDFYKVFWGMNDLQEVLINGDSNNQTNTRLWTQNGILYGNSYLLHVPRGLNIETIMMNGAVYYSASRIAPYALEGNKNKKIIISFNSGVSSIGNYAFANSQIESIRIAGYMFGTAGNYVDAFTDATNLSNITVDNSNTSSNCFTSFDGCLWNPNFTDLFYVPENWGVNKLDGGETFKLGTLVASIGNNRGDSGQKAFKNNRNIKYIVIDDQNGIYDEENINYHVDTMKRLDYVTVNDAIIYQSFQITSITTSISIGGLDVWSDGTNTYYSSGYTQKVWRNGQWVDMTWSGMSSFNGRYIWSGNNNIYYSEATTQKILIGSTWNNMTWEGLTSFYGDNVYYNQGAIMYQYESANSYYDYLYLGGGEWEKISDYTSRQGKYYWTDGKNTYYSQGSIQSKDWEGLTLFYGDDVWTDGKSIYYNHSYVLDTTLNKWRTTYRNCESDSIEGDYTWTDGTYVYYSNGTTTYVIGHTRSSSDLTKWEQYSSYSDDQFYYGASAIWTDDTNTYYSYGSTQKVWKEGTWEDKTWEGLTPFYGNHVWTDGANIYYSYKETQYVLVNDIWTEKTWSGLTSFNGEDVWTDGTNIYYSYYSGEDGAKHYVLENGQLTQKTWEGETDFSGKNVWTDGTNMYYSDGVLHLVLKDNKWTSKTWSGFSNTNAISGAAACLYGKDVWTDGVHTYFTSYYISGTIQYRHYYVLNGDTWESATERMNGVDHWVKGNNIWTDGINMYCIYATYESDEEENITSYSVMFYKLTIFSTNTCKQMCKKEGYV